MGKIGGGLTPLFSGAAARQFMQSKVDEMDEKAFKILQFIGEKFVNEARLKGNYTDRTGNLRSSIGYMIFKDGRIQDQNFQPSDKGTEREPGVERGQEFAQEIAAQHPNGWVLIGVAGMEYAAAVEALDGYDVITSSAPTEETFKRLFSAIDF